MIEFIIKYVGGAFLVLAAGALSLAFIGIILGTVGAVAYWTAKFFGVQI